MVLEPSFVAQTMEKMYTAHYLEWGKFPAGFILGPKESEVFFKEIYAEFMRRRQSSQGPDPAVPVGFDLPCEFLGLPITFSSVPQISLQIEPKLVLPMAHFQFQKAHQGLPTGRGPR
jgi:hypothetical protein